MFHNKTHLQIVLNKCMVILASSWIVTTRRVLVLIQVPALCAGRQAHAPAVATEQKNEKHDGRGGRR